MGPGDDTRLTTRFVDGVAKGEDCGGEEEGRGDL